MLALAGSKGGSPVPFNSLPQRGLKGAVTRKWYSDAFRHLGTLDARARAASASLAASKRAHAEALRKKYERGITHVKTEQIEASLLERLKQKVLIAKWKHGKNWNEKVRRAEKDKPGQAPILPFNRPGRDKPF